MKKILNILVLIILVVAVSLLLKLPTPIMIFGIWFVINIVTSIEKAKAKKSQKNKDPRNIPTKEIDDNEAFRNLREQTSPRNIEDMIESDIVIEVPDKNEGSTTINYNNIYRNEQKHLERQMLYKDRNNSIGNKITSIREEDAEPTILNTRSQKSVFLSTLSVEQAIIYDAMLNPKKLNYRFVKKV